MPAKKEEKIEEEKKEAPVKKSSKNNSKTKKPEKKKVSEAEFEKRVIELAKEGLTSEKIGEKLRKEGTHPKEHGVKISRILKKNNLWTNPDLKNVSEKLERITKHYTKNKQDKRAMREKDRFFSHRRKLEIYYKKKE